MRSIRGRRKRTAAGADFPSPKDPRVDEDSSDDGNHHEDSKKNTTTANNTSFRGGGCRLSSQSEAPVSGTRHTSPSSSSLFCAPWMRCMGQSSWMAVDDDSDIIVYDRPESSLNGTDAAVQGDEAEDFASLWLNINLDDGEEDNGMSNVDIIKTKPAEGEEAGMRIGCNLSPLTVAGPKAFPRRSSDSDFRSVVGSSARRPDGQRSISPLTVRAPKTSLRHSSSFAGNSSNSVSQKALGAPGSGNYLDQLRVGEVAGGGTTNIGRQGGQGQKEEGGVPFTASSGGLDQGAAAAVAAGSEEARQSRRQSSGAVMTVEPLSEEYDFEGRPIQLGNPIDSPFAAAFSVPGDLEEQHLVFAGLEKGTGQPLRTMAAKVHFSVGGHKAEMVVESLQEGANGRVYGVVRYPSMRELWQEVYDTPAVRVLEVDLHVEVRSRQGDVLYLESDLKVIYRREGPLPYQGASWRP